VDRRSFVAGMAALAVKSITSGSTTMAASNARKSFGDIAPALADYTEKVSFGDLWERSNLSPRDRSLVTIAALIALYRHNELPFHLKRAIENGVTRDEIVETVTHLAFYGGWPVANTALPVARKVFEETDK
jgi:4-carboxymuconolactone decarboxylase